MLQSNRAAVLVNHNPTPASTAVFPKDLVETQKGAVARIEITGSTADINSEAMVEFDIDALALDHGSLSVHTSHGLRVRVGCLTVTPVNPADWTQYDVLDIDGRVTVKAKQNDVDIDARSKNPQEIKQSQRSNRDLVKERDQRSRDEKCGGGDVKASSAMPGPGGTLNSPWVLATGIAGVGAVACIGFVCRNDDPASPAKP